MSYQDFLSALVQATVEDGYPHQLAGAYSAHRLCSEARTQERLLPLFWGLDRIAGGFEEKDLRKPTELTGELPTAGQSTSVLKRAMTERDPQDAERAIVGFVRTQGP